MPLDSPPEDWSAADWLGDDWLGDDWLVLEVGRVVSGVFAVLVAVVIARVTVFIRALWLSVSACWCR